jgi:hypothetical protein
MTRRRKAIHSEALEGMGLNTETPSSFWYYRYPKEEWRLIFPCMVGWAMANGIEVKPGPRWRLS